MTRRRTVRAALGLCLLLPVPDVASAQTGQPASAVPFALTNARIHPVSGPVLERGTLLIRDGRIIAVGPVESVRIPAGADVRDLAGRVIIPGLVDSHSHLGVYSRPQVPSNGDGNEMTGAVQSIVRAIDSINPLDPGIRMAQAGGVTTANIMPGSGNVIGGQTLYVKLRGRTVGEMLIEPDGVLGGLKMANGENPKRAYGSKQQAPMTRMKVAALQRSELLRAKEYLRKWTRYREKLAAAAPPADASAAGDQAGDDQTAKETGKQDTEPTPPDVDLALEPLVEVLQGRRTVHFHSHRADDILTVLRLREEFGFELVLQHGTEGYKVLDQLAAAKVPVSMTIVDSPGGKAEVVDFIEATGAELTAAGVPVHVNSDDPVTESRFLLRTAAATVRGGLDPDTALKAVTLHPAQALHLAHRVGSLEPGKDADFVVLSGEPFSVYSRVLETWINGRRVFDLNDDRQRLYQTGGFPQDDDARVPRQQELVAPLPPAAIPEAGRDAPPPAADSSSLIVVAGRIHTGTGEILEEAAIAVRDGRIVEVGPARQILARHNLPVLRAAEVTPGLIDTHTVVPLAGEFNIPADQDADEKTDPNQADVRVLDAFHPAEPLLRFLLEQGVTVVHATPGHANVIAGQTGVFRTHGDSAEAMTIRFPQAVLFNLGAAPKATYDGKAPGTRMGTAALIRRALQSATNYSRKKAAAGRKDDAEPPDPDLKHESLQLVLDQKVPAVFTAHRADDLLTALRLADEFQLRPVLALATEGYLIADELAKARVPVIVHPTMQRVGSLETWQSFLGNAAALADRGLPVSICSSFEGYVPKTRVIRWEAAMGMVHGLGRARAMRAVTLDAARILGIDPDYGSLEAGKVADLVLYDGDPFEHATHVTSVIVGGRPVYSRAERQQRLLVIDRREVSCPESGCCAAF